MRTSVYHPCISDSGGQSYGEEVGRVGEGAGGGEVGGLEQRGDCGWGEFVTIFGVDCFASSEVEGEGWSGRVGLDLHGLRQAGLQMHLNAGVGVVPQGAMGELIGLEVGAEFAIEAGEDVAVEGGGDAGLVVVGGEQGGDGF